VAEHAISIVLDLGGKLVEVHYITFACSAEVLNTLWTTVQRSPKMPKLMLWPSAESGKMDSNSGTKSESKKRVRSSWPSTQPESHVDSGSAPKEACLNPSTLYDPNSLMPHVLLLSYDLPEFRVLVDSSSMHCFEIPNMLSDTLSPLIPSL